MLAGPPEVISLMPHIEMLRFQLTPVAEVLEKCCHVDDCSVSLQNQAPDPARMYNQHLQAYLAQDADLAITCPPPNAKRTPLLSDLCDKAN